jgi:hypothetical protein
MAVSIAIFSTSGALNTGTCSSSHAHSGVPEGVAILGSTGTTATPGDTWGAVTYGGVALSEQAGSPYTAVTGSEIDAIIFKSFFRGDSLPSGTQTAQVLDDGGGASKRFGCWTFDAADDTEVVDTSFAAGTAADPAVTVSLGGVSSAVVLHFASGLNAVTDIAPASGWTSDEENDLGSITAGAYRYDTIGTSDVSASYVGLSEQYCLNAIAVREVAGGGGTTPKGIFGNPFFGPLGGPI